MEYDWGLEALGRQAEGKEWHEDFTVLEARLRENLAARDLYGDNPSLKSDRAACIKQLNRLALKHLGISFNDLCLGDVLPQTSHIKVEENVYRRRKERSMIKILFLAANPSDTTRLRLDEESRSIKQALHQTEFRDRFEVEQHWAVRVTDVQGLLLCHEPDIVHFSGHGSKIGEIVLEDNFGKSRPVSVRALSKLFTILKDNIRCVVLNACYSERQARAIAKHIDCVIGMSDSIGDLAAIGFATAFYQALGYGRDVKTAFDLGCLQIDLESLDEQDIPKLLALISKPQKLLFVS
jgi:hypothetical protein